MNHIKMVQIVNSGRILLGALELLNALAEQRLQSIFSKRDISLRMFLNGPATVASVERSFKLKIIKNYLRSTMGQDRLNRLATLSNESDIARQIDFDTIIHSFSKEKASKDTLF